MNTEKLKRIGYGALESAAIGFLVGVASVWGQPTDVLLTSAGVAAAATTGAKFGLIYLLGFLRQNAGLVAKA